MQAQEKAREHALLLKIQKAEQESEIQKNEVKAD
jgi:hypothetical protein